MKNILLLSLLVMLAMPAVAQYGPAVDVVVPRTLTAGTAMSGRTCAEALDDTTKPFYVRGYAAVYVGLETATNDTVQALFVAYQISKDGSSWGAFTLVDSLTTTGTVGVSKYIPLPANALGAYAVRARVYGRAGGSYSGPAATVTTKLVQVQYGQKKLR
jgi:hypothetical protein